MNYYISRSGQKFGPYSLADLQRYVGTGEIMQTDMAQGEGTQDWVPVSQVVGAGAAAAAGVGAPPPQSYPQPQQPQQPQQPGYPAGPGPQQPAPYQGGVPQQAYYPQPAYGMPPKSRTAYIILGIFLGCFGVHNFYAGYTGKGVAQLLITVLSFFLLSPVTAIWAIIEICTVDRDSRNAPMM